MAKGDDADGSLKRLGGGRWQTRDERFTIEPQSGTWVVVDAEQTDDLGLPLIRGPFGSLGDAKGAIASARTSGVPTRPLPTPPKRTPAADVETAADPACAKATAKAPEAPSAPKPKPKPKPEPPPEPRWLTDLASDDRRRARTAIKRLTDVDAPDPAGMARRDIAGDVPAIAAYALGVRIRALGPDATPEAVAALLADGRDDDLGVRWRVVDGEGRPILIKLDRTPATRAKRG